MTGRARTPTRAAALLSVVALAACARPGRATREPTPERPARALLPERGVVVFLGDSITWQNLYPAFVESYVGRALPERDVRFVNRGVRGDTAKDALERLERDVTSLDPVLVVVMLGMNDGGLGGVSGVLLGAYLGNMERLVERIEATSGARVLLLTSTPVDPVDDRMRAYDEMLALMSSGLVALGERRGIPTLDVFSRFRAALGEARRRVPPVELMADAIHPGPAGHLLVAHWLLEHLLPGGAARAEISATMPARASGSAASGLDLSHDGRNAWVPPEAAPALSLAPLRERLHGTRLVVGNAVCPLELSAGASPLGVFSPQELARGVDLDLLPTAPWVLEAERHYRLLQERWAWSYAAWDPRNRGVEAFEDVGGRWTGDARALKERARGEMARLDLELARTRGGSAQRFKLRAAERCTGGGELE